MAREKMSFEKKTKLFYSGELIFIAIVFAVIATLEIFGIVGKNEIMMTIFNWVTIFGGAWIIADFIWCLCSKKRRKKNSILDKALLLPLGIYFIVFDSLCFSKQPFVTMEFRRWMMSIAFYYVAVIYIFQGIFHYFHPIPAILEAIEEEKREREEEAKKDIIENEADDTFEEQLVKEIEDQNEEINKSDE